MICEELSGGGTGDELSLSRHRVAAPFAMLRGCYATEEDGGGESSRHTGQERRGKFGGVV
jgi:hypothetical protein